MIFPEQMISRLVVERGTPLTLVRKEIDASDVPLERIVVRPSSDEEDDAELVLAKAASRRRCSP